MGVGAGKAGAARPGRPRWLLLVLPLAASAWAAQRGRELARTRRALAAERAAAAELTARVDGLRAAERRRADLAAMVVHDLKTPLTGLLGYLRLLETRGEAATPEQRAEYLRAMDGQGRRVLGMVEDLLESSRLERGTQALERRPVDLVALARQAGADLDGRAGRRVEVEGVQLGEVYGDPGAVEQVLRNLVENAVAWSPPGGTVTVRVDDRSSEVLVGVRDQGPGVAAADAGSIFDRFQRARAGARDSVGLGLYLVKNLVQAHGGRVWCECTPGPGATFCFTLPRRAVRRPAAPLLEPRVSRSRPSGAGP